MQQARWSILEHLPTAEEDAKCASGTITADVWSSRPSHQVRAPSRLGALLIWVSPLYLLPLLEVVRPVFSARCRDNWKRQDFRQTPNLSLNWTNSRLGAIDRFVLFEVHDGRQAATFHADTYNYKRSEELRSVLIFLLHGCPFFGLGTCLGQLPQSVDHHHLWQIHLSWVWTVSSCPWLELSDTGYPQQSTVPFCILFVLSWSLENLKIWWTGQPAVVYESLISVASTHFH